MPQPKLDESKEEFIQRFMSSEEAKKDYPKEKQRIAVAHSMWREHKKSSSKERLCLKGLNFKEEDDGDIIVHGLAATTHPDNVGDILSEKAIDEIVNYINDTSKSGGETGAYRSVSLFHDWIKQEDPTLDEPAFLLPTAKKVSLDNGHYGVEVETKLNKYYRGEMDIDEIKYRIDNDQIVGYSIEYDTNDSDIKTVNYNGETYRFINSLSEFGGLGFARARLIANPHAVIYKEIVDEASKQKNEVHKMTDEEIPKNDVPIEPVQEPKVEPSKEPSEDKPKDELEQKEIKLDIKEIERKVKEQVLKELEVKSKIVKTTKEDELKMKVKETLPLSVKEMNEAIKGGKVNLMQFKEAARTYFAENDTKFDRLFQTTGIPLMNTLNVKCNGTKLEIVGKLQTKSILDQDTNAGAYTESIVEFADLFVPGLIETYNNQANLFGALRKVPHLMGGNYYGWKIKTNQADSLAVDPDDPSVVFSPVKKLKLHTEIKEYRVGVSVTDYLLHHARASMGDLFGIEVNAVMGDLMKDINDDLFTEQVDTAGVKILGLEAVADSAGNTEMYGKTRSTANRLSPAAAADTYQAVGGALTTAYLRDAYEKVEVEGARFENLRIVMNPRQRTKLYELNKSLQVLGQPSAFGFNAKGEQSWDSIPILMDVSCPNDAIFVYDDESYYIVMSRTPQLIGLAKVGAADSAYISTYFAAVYEQPRRVHMLDTLTA